MLETKTLETILTGTLGGVTVLGLWVRYLVGEIRTIRDAYTKELLAKDEIISLKDAELREVTKESIGCITQMSVMMTNIQSTLDKVSEFDLCEAPNNNTVNGE